MPQKVAHPSGKVRYLYCYREGWLFFSRVLPGRPGDDIDAQCLYEHTVETSAPERKTTDGEIAAFLTPSQTFQIGPRQATAACVGLCTFHAATSKRRTHMASGEMWKPGLASAAVPRLSMNRFSTNEVDFRKIVAGILRGGVGGGRGMGRGDESLGKKVGRDAQARRGPGRRPTRKKSDAFCRSPRKGYRFRGVSAPLNRRGPRPVHHTPIQFRQPKKFLTQNSFLFPGNHFLKGDSTHASWASKAPIVTRENSFWRGHFQTPEAEPTSGAPRLALDVFHTPQTAAAACGFEEDPRGETVRTRLCWLTATLHQSFNELDCGWPAPGFRIRSISILLSPEN